MHLPPLRPLPPVRKARGPHCASLVVHPDEPPVAHFPLSDMRAVDPLCTLCPRIERGVSFHFPAWNGAFILWWPLELRRVLPFSFRNSSSCLSFRSGSTGIHNQTFPFSLTDDCRCLEA